MNDRIIDGFWAIWRGDSPFALDVLGADVLAGLEASGRVEVDAEGRLRGIHGISLEPSAHRIAHAVSEARRNADSLASLAHSGRVVPTWCAFDAVGIPAALGLTADAVTSCPSCGAALTVHLEHGVPVDGHDFALWFPAFDCCAHVRNEFCRHANLYCSSAHLTALAPSEGRAITVVEAAELGRATWADVAGALRSAS